MRNDVPAEQHTVSDDRLRPQFGPMSMWAYSIGTSIGWGSLVVTCNTYLAQAGILGTVFGLIIGMLVTFVITHNLQYMICRNQDAGGIYKFAQKVCSHDFGFLAAWFLLITYMSVLWANITSVPLFARYFLGDIFRFGFHYRIFGYEVFFGESLLSIAAIVLAGLMCARLRKPISAIMTAAALTFVAGFIFCTLWAAFNHSKTGFVFDPLFVPDMTSISQIARIAVISPWAFIGFENITHFSEEYTFKVTRVRRILYVSVFMSTLVYIFVTLLSVTAYPPEYSNWLEYIRDMGNLAGFKAVPAFYAIDYYLGSTGVVILMLALFGAIITSLIGNTMALSRLLFAAGRGGDAPAWLKGRNAQGNPSNAVYAIVIISAFIPFIGRTAIGWIVDITTLGAIIIYGLASYSVFIDAKNNSMRLEKTTGITGLVIMLVFGVMLLLPHLFKFNSMAIESYVLFDLWAILGLLYFRKLISDDTACRYGHSFFVWFILLILVLFASMMWVSEATQGFTNGIMNEMYSYFRGTHTVEDGMQYVAEQSHKIHDMNALFTVASFAVFIVFTLIIVSNFKLMRKREAEHLEKLTAAEQRATTDQLTGTKNRHAYYLKEEEINKKIYEGGINEFALVVCDVNGLKLINDQKGHDMGDRCICTCCNLIKEVFKNSAVYRIGGDEFAVILEGEDYINRYGLIDKLNGKKALVEETTPASVAAGLSEFKKGEDASLLEVFTRADGMMYRTKADMKQ